jgi:hypothetical protein
VGMCASNGCGFYAEIATDVFKTQNPVLLKSLKDFLTDLPCSQSVEEILISAFDQLTKIDLDACRWLFHNSGYLLPEVDLVERTIKLAQILLKKRGFLRDQDFSFESKNRIYLSIKAKTELFAEMMPGDRIILEEILKIHDYE